MHIVALARGAYIASIAGEREEKRGQMDKTFLKGGEPVRHSLSNCMLISKQTKVAGAENGLCATLDPQFREDMAHMQLHRPWCHNQRQCNLLVGSPTCQQLQHLQFALAQWIK